MFFPNFSLDHLRIGFSVAMFLIFYAVVCVHGFGYGRQIGSNIERYFQQNNQEDNHEDEVAAPRPAGENKNNDMIRKRHSK